MFSERIPYMVRCSLIELPTLIPDVHVSSVLTTGCVDVKIIFARKGILASLT